MLEFFARTPGRPRDDGHAGRVHGDGAADGKVGVFAAHVAARHHQQLVHVRRSGDDRLGARDHDTARIALHHVQVAVNLGLLVRTPAAVAFGVGHRHAQHQILVLHPMQEIQKARAVLGAAHRVVEPSRHLRDGIHAVVRQVALGATGLLTNQPNRLEFVEQVARTCVGVHQTVDAFAAAALHRRHDRRIALDMRIVIGQRDRVDAGSECALVDDAVDLPAVKKHPRLVAPQ